MAARAITGTSWNGHRFFGLETGRSRSQMTSRRRDERPVGKVSGAGRCTGAVTRRSPQGSTMKPTERTPFFASSRLFDLNGEARMAKTNHNSAIIASI